MQNKLYFWIRENQSTKTKLSSYELYKKCQCYEPSIEKAFSTFMLSTRFYVCNNLTSTNRMTRKIPYNFQLETIGGKFFFTQTQETIKIIKKTIINTIIYTWIVSPFLFSLRITSTITLTQMNFFPRNHTVSTTIFTFSR